MLSQIDLQHIDYAIKILSKSGVIAVPTDTVYGIAADFEDKKAINRISEIKGRENSKQYVLQISSFHQLEQLTEKLSKENIRIVEKYWPGQVTFIFNINPLLKLEYLKETIAIRMPKHELMLKLLDLYRRPLIVTSLNKSGEMAVCSEKDISEELRSSLDYVLGSLEETSNVASTIIDLTQKNPKVIRQGVIILE